MEKVRLLGGILLVGAFLFSPSPGRAGGGKVVVGLNAEASHPTSTSDDAIKQGLLVAIDEINRAGGVLGGRTLELVEKDNRSVPARAAQNNRELAVLPDLVAVFGGKFSSAIIESLPVIHELKLPLMTPWSANDKVVDNGYNPNYVFRLSINDTWAIDAMMSHARRQGCRQVGLLVPNNSWGRNNVEVIRRFVAADPKMRITSTQWYNYGEKSLAAQYEAILASGAAAVIVVAIETEGALLVREVALLPEKKRLPLIATASITGGDFPKMTGDALGKVRLVFPQTYNLHENVSERTRSVMATAQRLFGVKAPVDIKSPMGFVHAYDLMRILALAIDKAGTTDRAAVRDALEKIAVYDGLIMRYAQPFTASRHDALGPGNVMMARYDATGIIRKIK